MQDIQDNFDDIVDARLPVLDLETFSNLAGLLGQPRVLSLTAAFFADAERRLSALEGGAAAAGDLREHAHALVSMAGHLGLKRLSALCLHLQDNPHERSWRAAPTSMRTSLTSAREAIVLQL